MTARLPALTFNAALVAVAAAALLTAMRWPSEVAFFPAGVAGAALLLTGAQLGVEGWRLLRRGRRREAPAAPAQESADETTLGWFGPAWFFGFIVAVILLSIPIGLPIMVILLLRFGFKQRWWVAVGSAILIEVVLLAFFELVIGVIWPDPLLLALLP